MAGKALRSPVTRSLRTIVALCVMSPCASHIHSQVVVGGQVVDQQTQRGLPAALVRLVDETSVVRGIAVTDRYGGYLLTVPTPGTYTLHAHAWGYHPEQLESVPIVGDTVVSVMLAPATEKTSDEFVTGVVLDDRTDQLVVSASVLLIDEDDKVRNATTTDENGLYGVSAPEPGSYTLRVDAARYATLLTAVFDLQQDQVAGVAVRLTSIARQDPQTVRGEVVDDSTAAPIAGAEVNVLDSLGRSVGSDRRQTVLPWKPGYRVVM